jgi:phosphoserine phosphatase RsbU/P
VRILIAEDDSTSRAMLAAVLRKNGHEVVETRDGAEALRFMEADDAPRLAILDWLMPEMDGLQVCRRLRSAASGNPPYLIILTTCAGSGAVVEGLDAGADDYLVKPYNSSELLARVHVGQRIVALQDALADKVHQLSDALAKIKTLHGILPICSFCRKIRDDEEGWRLLEEYVSAHADVLFSHGICPDCLQKMYPEYVNELNKEIDC